MNTNQTSKSNEMKIVLILSFGFGLVGLERFIIAPLFPTIMKELNLDYSMLGYLTAVLGVTWGLSSMFLGSLSDKLGRKKILIPAVLMFSLLGGLSGFASGFLMLMVLRGVMGVFEGAFTPTSIAAIQDNSSPKRVGINTGIQQSVMPLFGWGLSPIIATQLLNILPSWHWVFFVVALPGLIVAYYIYKWIPEPKYTQTEAPKNNIQSHTTKKTRWYEIFKYRNVYVGLFGFLGSLTALVTLNAFMPNYLTEYLNISLSQMGLIISGIGLGAFVGAIIIPTLSDRINRKSVIVVASIIALITSILLVNIGANSILLFIALFIIAFCAYGNVTTIVGPVLTGAVPKTLIATAAAIPIGIGEVFAGGIFPSIAGVLAQSNGIQAIVYIPIIGLVIATLSLFFLKKNELVELHEEVSSHVLTASTTEE